MSHKPKIYLANGVTLHISNGLLTCMDEDDTIIALTAGQQKLLKKLAETPNRPVPFDTLYAAYTNEDQQLTYAGISNSNLAKMKRTFPNCIRPYIKNVRNVGYYLEAAPQPTDSPRESHNDISYLTQLCGDYYGFYLDPLGTGELLSAYFHIETAGNNDAAQLNAFIIFGIRSREVLFSPELRNIFSKNVLDPKTAVEAYKDTLSENDRRFSYGEGMVLCNENMASIVLNMNRGSFELLLSLENYIKGGRKKEREENFFRGGMGLLISTKTFHGTYCIRMGLVKKEFLKDGFFEKQEEIKRMLKIHDSSETAEWKPLKLSETLDRLWYNLFMSEGRL